MSKARVIIAAGIIIIFVCASMRPLIEHFDIPKNEEELDDFWDNVRRLSSKAVTATLGSTMACNMYKDCASCAQAAGCGWCGKEGICTVMAQDGFPARTRGVRQVPVCEPYSFILDANKC